jgi:hypothetical protein
MKLTSTSPIPKQPQKFNVKRLLDCLGGAPAASPGEVADQFLMVRRVIASLPLTLQEFCFALNWITSARRLWENGDAAAARYQIDLVAKRLQL